MLTHLDIAHFITIDKAHIAFTHGLTVVTGDTGAGKSLLIAAIQFGLGQKFTFKQNKQTQVSLTFDTHALPHVQTWLTSQGFSDNEGQCILTRSLNDKQRSRCFVNQTPTTLSTLAQLGEMLLDIHGQHDSTHLRKNEVQRSLVDRFCKDHKLPTQVKQAYQRWHQHHQALKQAQTSKAQQMAQSQLLEYQLKELNAWDLSQDNVQHLDQLQKRLANAEQLCQSYTTLHAELSGNQDTAIIDRMQHLLQKTTAMESTLPESKAIAEALNQAIIHLEDAAQLIQSQQNCLRPDPEKLAETDHTLSQLHDLARKHQVRLHELETKKCELNQSYDELCQQQSDLETLEAASKKSLEQALILAKQLSEQRKEASVILSERITQYMQALNFLQAKVRIKCQSQQSSDQIIMPKPHGLDHINFEISTNPGQALQPLSAVASGGELSRISLAIQVACSEKKTLPTLIFDEVDVGIGGKTAEMVGKQLRELGQNTQVICITHLPQVASQGHHHLCVEKKANDGNTLTELKQLSKQDRINEIARMVGGIDITDKTLAHAEAMLAGA